MKEINVKFTIEKNSEVKLIIRLFINVQRGSREKIWALQRFFAISLILVNLHPDKILFFI